MTQSTSIPWYSAKGLNMNMESAGRWNSTTPVHPALFRFLLCPFRRMGIKVNPGRLMAPQVKVLAPNPGDLISVPGALTMEGENGISASSLQPPHKLRDSGPAPYPINKCIFKIIKNKMIGNNR